MKLKEKFNTMVLDRDIADWEKACEQIADEFAIRFAEWLVIRYNEDIIYDEYSTKELLEIYKKENKL